MTDPKTALAPSDITQIVMLGTGNPNPDPDRQGPALAIIVNGQPYLVDCGAGVVRQTAAARRLGMDSLGLERLTRVFITHLHSDHTLGLPDLIFTPAVMGRPQGIQIYGPSGTADMVKHIEAAWALDRGVRLHGGEPSDPASYETFVTDIEPGQAYRDENVTVEAFPVLHGSWEHAFGFRFQTPDRVIVVSGDTTYCPALIEHAKGCDVLIHEAYSAEGLKNRTPVWQAYHSAYHTSGLDVGRIARQVNPKLLVLYHLLPMGQPAGQIATEVRAGFAGTVVEAADLDRF